MVWLRALMANGSAGVAADKIMYGGLEFGWNCLLETRHMPTLHP